MISLHNYEDSEDSNDWRLDDLWLDDSGKICTYRVFKQQVYFFDPYPDPTSMNQNVWNSFPDFLKVGNLWGNHKKLSFCPISLPVFDLVSWWKYARKELIVPC